MNRLPRVISQAAPSWARVVARRSMGGDAHHAVRKGPQPGEFGGFEPPHVAPVHKYIGEGFMVLTWLWLMYRFKQDGKVLFVSVVAVCLPRCSALLPAVLERARCSHDARVIWASSMPCPASRAPLTLSPRSASPRAGPGVPMGKPRGPVRG